jgi:aconitate hydratase
LPEEVANAVTENDLTVVAVLSGNRNFDGRIHPLVRGSYLASPPLVVAYALAGHVGVDLANDPIGTAADGTRLLRDLWPSPRSARGDRGIGRAEQFEREYGRVFEGDERWRALPTPPGDVYAWDPASTYVQEPPFFDGERGEPADIVGARCLVKVGDSVTTDHISPAGSIKADSPAGAYLVERGVKPAEFNSYGARRGNHEVMMRGTFANIRLRNDLAPGTEGPWTTHLPSGEVVTIFDAALRYASERVPLVVLAGREYGSGSSRDWAAKGPMLLGVRAILAESYERIHRSNLVGMGVLPLQFRKGECGLDRAVRDRGLRRPGLADGIVPARRSRSSPRLEGDVTFRAILRVDGAAEVEFVCQGGLLPMVLRQLQAG